MGFVNIDIIGEGIANTGDSLTISNIEGVIIFNIDIDDIIDIINGINDINNSLYSETIIISGIPI
jgi:hypothetical protein